jgi:peptidoglycan DL-endopeptidase LytF
MRRIRAQQHCPPNSASYFVQPGDTLNSIASRFHTIASAIEAANPGINVYALQAGQEVCIPSQVTYAPCIGGDYYVVRRGDTLPDLARRNNITADRLLAANLHINPNTLVIGQVICIPR